MHVCVTKVSGQITTSLKKKVIENPNFSWIIAASFCLV